MKKCYKCGELKAQHEFNKNKTKRDGLSVECRLCNKEILREWHSANKEYSKEQNRKWRCDNKGRHNEMTRVWKKANPDRINALDAKRRAQRLQATPPWLTEEQYEQITLVYAQSTALTKETGIKHHVDHIVPLQGKNVCGLHVPWNLQVLSATENIKKHNRLEMEGLRCR